MRLALLLILFSMSGCQSALDSIETINAQTSYTDGNGHTFSQGVGVTLRQRHNTSGK